MKIAILNDTHWGARNDNAAIAEHQIKFYREVFFPYLRENGITTIFHLGDVTDRRKYINFVTAKNLEDNFNDKVKLDDEDIARIDGLDCNDRQATPDFAPQWDQ